MNCGDNDDPDGPYMSNSSSRDASSSQAAGESLNGTMENCKNKDNDDLQFTSPVSTGATKARAAPNTDSSTATATAATTNSATNSVINTGSVKKRPYIRTKRPAGYNDKSSITTTTDALWQQPLNVYDAVLSESQDLLQAAAEAQQLGRLKMASAYLLLLHARLVGLGKRFDKAPPPPDEEQGGDNNDKPSDELGDNESADVALDQPNKKSRSTTDSMKQAATSNTNTATNTTLLPEDATQALARFLPSNIELDTAMMEHLARAAAELHAARCSGRPVVQQSPGSAGANVATGSTGADMAAAGAGLTTHVGVTESLHLHHSSLFHSPNAREFLASTANERGVTNAATETGVATKRMVRQIERPDKAVVGAATAAASMNYTSRTFGAQWNQATAGTMSSSSTTASKTYSLIGRPTTTDTTLQPQQQQALQNINIKVEEEMQQGGHDTDDDNDATPKKMTHSKANTPSSAASVTAAKAATPASTNNTPNTSGVRCKPVTAAMNTVPHANCNARALLQGVASTATAAAPYSTNNKSKPPPPGPSNKA